MSNISDLRDNISGLINTALEALARGVPLDVNQPNNFDLTPNRYITFERILGTTSIFKKCLSLLQKRFGQNHSRDLLVKLLADLVYKLISPELGSNRLDPNVIQDLLSEECNSLISELEKPNWSVYCLAPLFNLEWEVPQDNDYEQDLMPGVKLIKDQLFLDSIGSQFKVTDSLKRDVKTWCEIVYQVPKSKVEYSELLQTDKARHRFCDVLLALRLFRKGDIGSNVILCKIEKPIWPFYNVPVTFSVPITYGESFTVYLEPYELSVVDKSSMQLLEFAHQLDIILNLLDDTRIEIACENFMSAYSGDPLKRLSRYMTALQAMFMKPCDRGVTTELSWRVPKFLGRNSTEYAQIRDVIQDGYQMIRSPVEHGWAWPSMKEREAIEKLTSLEQYCREAIFFFISLAKKGDLDRILDKLESLDYEGILEIRRKANLAFWSDRKVIPIIDGKEVYFEMW